MVVEQRRAVDVDDASGGETNAAFGDGGGRGEEVVVAVAAAVVVTTVVAAFTGYIRDLYLFYLDTIQNEMNKFRSILFF